MKVQINLTDSIYDLERFGSRAELKDLLEGFDGIELMHLEEDSGCIISDEMVIGYHTTMPEYWMDFRRGDMARCLQEFDSTENIKNHYGGTSPDCLVRKLRGEYENVLKYGAEYMVIHVSDAGIFEEITGKYHYSDEEVIRGFCELVNEALPAEKGKDKGSDTGKGADTNKNMPWLLMENLWQPGLTFRNPEMTRLLIENIHYPKKGFMLDTGHLIHTNTRIRTQKEAVSFINRQLDDHGDLCRYIKGVHLNQSITGPLMNRYKKHPPQPAAAYEERVGQLFDYIFRIDKHLPFTGEGVRELVERIAPDYLTYEFISNNLEEHKMMLKKQRKVFDQVH